MKKIISFLAASLVASACYAEFGEDIQIKLTNSLSQAMSYTNNVRGGVETSQPQQYIANAKFLFASSGNYTVTVQQAISSRLYDDTTIETNTYTILSSFIGTNTSAIWTPEAGAVWVTGKDVLSFTADGASTGNLCRVNIQLAK